MVKVSSFCMTDAVERILQEIPWGKRSDFINSCILEQVARMRKTIKQKDELDDIE